MFQVFRQHESWNLKRETWPVNPLVEGLSGAL